MANYYHEARKQVQALKKTTEDNRRRAERRQELAIIDVRFCSWHLMPITLPSTSLLLCARTPVEPTCKDMMFLFLSKPGPIWISATAIEAAPHHRPCRRRPASAACEWTGGPASSPAAHDALPGGGGA